MSLETHWMARLALAGLATLTLSANALAQTPYQVSHSTGTYVAFTGGTTHTPVAYGSFGAEDEGSVAIALPFPFIFYGQTYNTVHAYTNGLLSFSPPPGTLLGPLRQPSVVPSPGNLVHNFIGVMWHDLTAQPNGVIRSRVTGTAGSRVMEIQYEDFVGFSASAAQVNFQVRLYEGTNAVQIQFGPNSGWNPQNGGTTAIENATGNDGINLMSMSPTCGAACACLPSRCGTPNWVEGQTIDIQLPVAPELTGTITAPAGARPNQMFDVQVTIFNSGQQPVGPFQYGIYLAPTNTSTAGSAVLGTFGVAGLAAASSVQQTRTLTVPAGTALGEFYIALKVDIGNTVTEALEDNNRSFDGPFGTAPDLTGTILPPMDSGPGEPFNVNFSVRSDGAPVTGPIGVQLYLSPTQSFDMMTALPLGPASVTLPNGFRFNGTVTVTMPLNIPPSPPSYYAVAVLDDQDVQIELDEGNNVLVSATTVSVRGPDLVGVDFVGGDFGFRGETYPLSTEFRNAGGARATNFTVCVFLSDNQVISVATDDLILETAPMTLQANERRTLLLEPTIPPGTTPGTWYIAAVYDCQDSVPESLETNNTEVRPQTIEVRDPSPDLVPLTVDTVSSAVAGETTPVSVTYANLGNASGDATLRIVLSTNPGITTDDLTLFETAMPVTLDPSDIDTVAEWIPLPADTPSGTYYIGAIVDPDDVADETFEQNNTLASASIVIEGTDLAVVSAPPPNAVFGVPYARRFAAVGGSDPYTWSIDWGGGQPPAGLTFEAATAEISGTPAMSAEGSHPFDITVTSGDLFATRSYTLIVSGPTIPLTLVSSRLPPALALERYFVELVAVGGNPPYVWRSIDPLPFGLALDSDGILGGEPQLINAFNFEISVTDANGTTVRGTLSLDVVDARTSVSIQQADVAGGIVGMPYTFEFTAVGGGTPYTWRIDGEVPGLTFDDNGALFTGTPTTAGEYPLLVEVRDTAGLIDRNAYVLEVSPEGVLRIVTGTDADSALPEATLNQPYTAEGGEAVRLRASATHVTWSVVLGELPPGLTLEASTGIIGGTPTEAGSYAFVAFARTDANDTRRQALAIVVRDPNADTTGPGGDGCGCTTSRRSGAAAWGLLLLLVPLIRRRSWLGLLFVLFTSTASAQTPYQVLTEPEPYVHLGPGAVEMVPGLGDGQTEPIQLPFR